MDDQMIRIEKTHQMQRILQDQYQLPNNQMQLLEQGSQKKVAGIFTKTFFLKCCIGLLMSSLIFGFEIKCAKADEIVEVNNLTKSDEYTKSDELRKSDEHTKSDELTKSDEIIETQSLQVPLDTNTYSRITAINQGSVGDTVDVTFTVHSGEACIDTVWGMITYDASMLSCEGYAGRIGVPETTLAEDLEEYHLIFQFTILKPGESEITYSANVLTRYDVELYKNLDASMTIVGGTTPGGTDLSNDCSLMVLSSSAGEEDPSVLIHYVTVPNEVTSFAISAICNDENARTSITEGADRQLALMEGDNKIVLCVTACDGITKAYHTFIVKRLTDKDVDASIDVTGEGESVSLEESSVPKDLTDESGSEKSEEDIHTSFSTDVEDSASVFESDTTHLNEYETGEEVEDATKEVGEAIAEQDKMSVVWISVGIILLLLCITGVGIIRGKGIDRKS